MDPSEFNWLQLRIAEEKDRREREAMITERLPVAAAQLEESLAACVASYNAAFGPRAAELEKSFSRIHLVVREEAAGGVWRERARVEITMVPALPGFEIDRAGSPLRVEIGLLPENKVSFRDHEKDQYLSIEALTERVLDQVLFPKLSR